MGKWTVCGAAALGLLLGGCAGGEDDTGGSAAGEMLTGTITPDGASHSGEVAIAKAFAFDQGGKFIVYMSSDPASSCEKVYDYLGGSDKAYDPVDIFNDGYCNMFVLLGSGYDGGIEAQDDLIVGAGTAIECPMGDGAWVYETRDGDDKDYFWDPESQWWVGHPETYTYSFSGSGESGYTLDIDMSYYDGGYPYLEWENTPATGEVSGTVSAEYCQPLATLGFF